jgi:hypothetical protein
LICQKVYACSEYQYLLMKQFGADFVTDQIIVPPIFKADIISYDSHGFWKPFPFFKWCFNSFDSSGTAPVTLAGDVTTAYRAADICAEDITAVLP